MASRTHFLTEFDRHLVDLTFVRKVLNGVQMGLWASMLGKLWGPTAIYTDGSKTEGFGWIWDNFG
jgi:hypothetical protein